MNRFRDVKPANIILCEQGGCARSQRPHHPPKAGREDSRCRRKGASGLDPQIEGPMNIAVQVLDDQVILAEIAENDGYWEGVR